MHTALRHAPKPSDVEIEARLTMPIARQITADPESAGLAYTIATLVTKPAQYDAMVASFVDGGFTPADCEFLYIDNAGGNQLSAYEGLNRALNEARGRYVILCHQDVQLLADGREALDLRLAELSRLDPAWALAGNAGGVSPGRLAARISDPHGAEQDTGDLPARVASLDENFIIVRRASRVSFSRDLDGFHFYGTDICLQAELAGWSAYVIDFHLLHLSGGRKTPDFYDCERNLRDKYGHAFRSRWVQTTCALVPLSGNGLTRTAALTVRDLFARLARRLPSSRGWQPRQRTASPARGQ